MSQSGENPPSSGTPVDPDADTDASAEDKPADHPEMSAEMKRSNLIFSIALPLFFMVMFPLCYITALHQPIPHHLPVAVVGSGAAGFIAHVGPALAGKFDLIPVGSTGQATDMILNQTVKAAYVPAPSGHPAHMLVAGADGRLVSQLLPTAFRPIAAGTGNTLQVQDIAPLAPGDGNGIGLMFFMLITVIVGFMAANILGNAAFFVQMGRRIAICAGIALLVPIVVWAFMGPWLQIIVGSPGAIIASLAIAAAASFTTALITTATVAFISKWALFPCMLVFIFLNIPSSNSAYPAEIVPPLFGSISHVHLGAAMVGAIRSILYLHGAGLRGHLVTMGVWAAVAVALTGAAVLYNRRKAARAEEASDDDSDDDEESPPAEPDAPAVPDGEPEQASATGTGRALRGQVSARQGEPLPRAVVMVANPAGDQLGRASTGADGRFHISDLADGTYTVVATADGHRPAARTVVLNGAAPHPSRHEDVARFQLTPADPGDEPAERMPAP